MRKSNFALRLQPSLLEEARKLAEAEGVTLNQFINLAVALRTESYIAERAARANIPMALDILKRAGVGRRPMKSDELSRSTRSKLAFSSTGTAVAPAYESGTRRRARSLRLSGLKF